MLIGIGIGICMSQGQGSFEALPETPKEPPTAPSGLTASGITINAFNISWTENPEPDVIGYNVYLNDTKQNTSYVTSTSYSFSNAEPETSYSVGVSAINIYGMESAVTTINVMTLAEPEEPPPTEPDKHLHVNGAGDYLISPAMMYDEIRMDYIYQARGSASLQYHFDARDAETTSGRPFLYSPGDEGVESISGIGTLTVNGVEVSNGTDFIKPDERLDLIAKLNSPITGPITFFTRYTFIQSVRADVFRITILNAGNIVADYDMSTGTVEDQSGNGNHATLVGGTWVST